jgi:ornithine carbamoyltransferase
MSNLQNVFQGRSFLACKDFQPTELNYLIDFALHLKELKKKGIPHRYLEGKNIALLFEKASTRTRSAFVIACNDLGAHPEYMGAGEIHLGKKESIKDTARVLGSMFDGIEYRGFAHKDVETLSKYAGVPVWNGLTDEWHPTQMLADFMTVKEKFGRLQGITLTYVGDGEDNVANSLLVAGSMLGVNIHIVAPQSLQPKPEVQALAESFAKKSGSQNLITDDIKKGVLHSNVIYTDVWVSMGADNWAERIKLLKPYQVNMAMMKATETPADQLIFMHCLPAFHNTETTIGQQSYEKYGVDAMEVTEDVFESDYAWQFTEAENRLHSIKAIMAATLGNLFIPRV